MLTKIKTALMAIAMFAAFNYANAQEQPKMPEALSHLMLLAGQWEGQGTLKLDGKTYSFPYYGNFVKTADGSGLYMEEWFNSADLGNLKGSNLIGFNSNDGKIHWFGVDNMGTTHDHLGMWKSADHFFMQAREVQQKKKFVENIDLVFKDNNNTMDFTLVATLDGKEIERGTVTFHRVNKEQSRK